MAILSNGGDRLKSLRVGSKIFGIWVVVRSGKFSLS